MSQDFGDYAVTGSEFIDYKFKMESRVKALENFALTIIRLMARKDLAQGRLIAGEMDVEKAMAYIVEPWTDEEIAEGMSGLGDFLKGPQPWPEDAKG